MWVVSILPLGKAAPQRELSYFSPADLEEGGVAKISARGKTAFGLVIRSSPLSEMKQHVRAAGFALQKISGGARRIVTREFLHAAFELGREHACSAGAVLADLIPAAILEAASKLPEAVFVPLSAEAPGERPAEEFLAGPRDARIAAYAKLAAETLSAERSFLCIAPTVAEAARIARELDRAAGGVVLLHGALSKKQMRETWSRAAKSARPLVIVGTALALSSPRRDIGCVVLERSAASAYARDERPFLSIGACARALARALGARFVSAAAAPTGCAE